MCSKYPSQVAFTGQHLRPNFISYSPGGEVAWDMRGQQFESGYGISKHIEMGPLSSQGDSTSEIP